MANTPSFYRSTALKLVFPQEVQSGEAGNVMEALGMAHDVEPDVFDLSLSRVSLFP